MNIDPIMLTVIFKGTAMVLLIVGGIYALRKGFHLYRDGIGADKDAMILQWGKFKAAGRSIGSVVMVTAVGWAALGVAVSPDIDKRGDDVKVSIRTPEGEITTHSIQASVNNAATAAKSPETITKAFTRSVERGERIHGDSLIEVNGKPAEIDPSSVRTFKSAGGTIEVLANVRAGPNSAIVRFKPLAERNRIVFEPSEAKFAKPDPAEKAQDTPPK